MCVFAFTEKFKESLRALTPEIQEHIKSKLGFYELCENPFLFAKKLQGFPGIYRLRVGDYRAVFRVEGSVYVFLVVKHRKDIYRGL